MNILKKSDIAGIFPKRDSNSHKGQNGRVLIIGGSLAYHGAPILAGLGALGSGSDLVTLVVPECNFEVTRSFYPDFIVRKYVGNLINTRTIDVALELLPHIDCLLIGPGVSEDPEVLRVITRIITKAPCHIVLDAEAIPALAQLGLPEMRGDEMDARFTITPHRGEMDELISGPLPDDEGQQQKIVEDFSHKWGVTILLKGSHDIIAAPGMPTRVNTTGNAGMTVGGTGDVLAGLTASLIAQHISPYDACQCAAYLNGAAGDMMHKQKGNNFIATDVALELPFTINSVVG